MGSLTLRGKTLQIDRLTWTYICVHTHTHTHMHTHTHIYIYIHTIVYIYKDIIMSFCNGVVHLVYLSLLYE